MVELIGVDVLLMRLAEYPDIRDDEYELAALQGMNVVIARAAEYPDVPAGSQYIRTFTLKAGWYELDMKWEPVPDGFYATTENPVSYGPYVMGGKDDYPQQAKIHYAYWKTTDTILDDSEPEILDFFDAATQRIVKRLGG